MAPRLLLACSLVWYAAEAAGLELENINLDDHVIHLVYLKDRPLKTKYSVRDIPIHPNNFELCKTLVDKGTRPFPMYWKPNRRRWEASNNWRRRQLQPSPPQTPGHYLHEECWVSRIYR